jgi:predicted DNA-binding ribbon-helix-helix protein
LSTTVSKNVFIGEQRTSVRLETVEWDALDEICRDLNCRLRDLCLEIFSTKAEDRSFTSALRVYTLSYFRKKAQLVKREDVTAGGLQMTSISKAGSVKKESMVETTTMPATSPGELS